MGRAKRRTFNVHKHDYHVLSNNVTRDQAERWLKFYQENYPNYEFELVDNEPPKGESDGKESKSKD